MNAAEEKSRHALSTIYLHSRAFLPAAPREPLAQRGRGRRLGRPFHDWNERITRECYAPNMRARLLDHDGRIIQLLNNYAWMSFNFGPTLLQWMAGHAPEVHQGIVEADHAEPEPARRARQCPGAGLQPPDHAAGEQARQGDAGRLGHRRLPPSIRPRPRGDVAGGDGRRYRVARGAGRGRHRIHDPGSAASEAVAEDGEQGVAGAGRRDRPVACLSLPLAVGPIDRLVFSRRHRLAPGRLRAAAR